MMIEVFDFWPVSRRIGRHVVFQRHRNVDHLARHRVLLLCRPGLCRPHMILVCLPVIKCPAQGRGYVEKECFMPAYWVARSKVNDPVEYKKYTDFVPGIIAKFGGKVLARGGRFQIMEGPD